MTFAKTSSTIRMALCATALTLIGSAASADQVILDDLIVDGSLCVGLDCVNGESFGFDTIRMKENNLRLHFQDTSSSASFPTRDWRIVANDSSNGGASYLAFEDTDFGRQTFRVFSGAPANSLVVRDNGNLGLGTSTPVVEVHVKDGDTPTVRLEQDGSSGFTPQTWDMAGNETNFFIRDTTGGSDLVLRLRAGAPANSIFVDTDGDVGMGDSTPDAALDILRTGSRVSMEMEATTNDSRWQMIVDADSDPNAGYSLTRAGTGAREFRLTPTGNLIITGHLKSGSTCLQMNTLACTFSVASGASCVVGNCP